MNRPAPHHLFHALRNRRPAPPPQGELFQLVRQLPVMKADPAEDGMHKRMPIWSQALTEKQTRH